MTDEELIRPYLALTEAYRRQNKRELYRNIVSRLLLLYVTFGASMKVRSIETIELWSFTQGKYYMNKLALLGLLDKRKPYYTFSEHGADYITRLLGTARKLNEGRNYFIDRPPTDPRK